MNAIAHIKLVDGQAFELPCTITENKFVHAVMLIGISLESCPPPKEVLIKVIDQPEITR